MARYLLDTNIVIFFLLNSDDLEKETSNIITDYNNQLHVSTISIPEIIHLYKRGKIKNGWKTMEDILPSIEVNFKILPVKREHLLTYSRLLTPADHNDPYDHVIISQAITEKITLISSDNDFEYYVGQKLDFIFNKR